mmetsp:Transcript_3226/g.9360  ORF Transcript_3226/g.9360 Transcript_3226/m.9360 type:complete len:208 (-) Transcript_3226:1179-1802(-)
MEIVPDWSVSRNRHAAAAEPSNFRRLQASRNSGQDKLLESSRSRMVRHARSKWPHDLSSNSRSFSHSPASGSESTHSRGFHASNQARSPRSIMPKPFKSRQVITHLLTSLFPISGQPRDLRVSLKTGACMLFSRNQVPVSLRDAAAASGVSHIAEQLPKRCFAHNWNRAKMKASWTANSSKRTTPSLSPSQSLNKSCTWIVKLCIAQ